MSKDEIIAKQGEQIAAQGKLLQAALLRIAELEAQLKMNSSTSGQPPSSDGLKKKPAFPRIKGGRRGGKPGHQGNTLKMVDRPDKHRVYGPRKRKCLCGCELSGVKARLTDEKRQVFDLPPQLLEVTEHRISVKQCPDCGQRHSGTFPDQINAPVQYGSRVRALINLLNVEQSLPVGRVKELFASLTGYALNENSVIGAVNRMAQDLEPDTEIIKQNILASSVAHADETGARVAGKLHWGHDLVTELYTYFFVSEKRGKIALNSADSITAQFPGTLIHDCWAPYFNLACADHGLCGAHVLRELRNLAENYESKWAGRMHDLLMYAYKFSDNGKSVLPANKLRIVRVQYARIIASADKEEPPPITNKKGKPKKSKGRNLMDRMKKYESYVLNFALRKDVPFTNNLAERDIRPWKTKLKVSGCFRTLEGAKKYARVKGFCSTAKKHGYSVYEQLVKAIDGQSFLMTAPLT